MNDKVVVSSFINHSLAKNVAIVTHGISAIVTSTTKKNTTAMRLSTRGPIQIGMWYRSGASETIFLKSQCGLNRDLKDRV